MWRKVLPLLLMVGWVSLSIFDVVEDLGGIPGETVSSAPPENSTSTAGRRGSLANNIVESANRSPDDHVALAKCAATVCDLNLVRSFRRHFPLHKLYHVFLI